MVLRTEPNERAGAAFLDAGRRIIVTAKQAGLGVDVVIDPDANGVKRRRVRVARIELRQTLPQAGRRLELDTRSSKAVWPLKLAGATRRLERLFPVRWLAQSKSLVGEKEESFIFADRTTEYAAEIILLFLGFRQMMQVRKPVFSVQYAIPKIVEHRAVKTIRSGTGQDTKSVRPGCDRTPAQTKRFGYRNSCMASTETKLFVPPKAPRAGSAPRGALHQWSESCDTEICADPIHGEIVSIRALTVHAELSLVVESRGSQDHPRARALSTSGRLLPLRGRFSTYDQSITVLTAVDSVFNAGASLSQ